MKKNKIGKNETKPVGKIYNFYSEIKYAIVPFFIFALVLMVSYFGNQSIYDIFNLSGSDYPKIPLDDEIPLIPWFVYFYYLTFPLGLLTFFCLAYKNKKELYDIFLTLCISFAISGIIYLVGQTEFVKPDFTPVTFTDKLVVWTWGSVNPINCFPSQHCFMAFAVLIACFNGKKMNKFYRLFASCCAIMIILSTVFIRQHYLLDIIASFDIMLSVFAIVYVFKLGEKLKNSQEQKYKDRQLKKILKEISNKNNKLN